MSYFLRTDATQRFVETSIHRQVVNAIDFTLSMGNPSLIVGKPGIGKSTSLRRIADTDSKAVYLMIGNGQRTVRALYRAVLAAFEINYYRRNNIDLGEIVYHHLPYEATRGRYLLIDEYQVLDVDALRELLNFHEICKLPIVISGNRGRLKRSGADSYTYEQISSRIAKTVELKSPVRDDFIQIGVEHNVEGKDAYEALVQLGLQTSIRQLVQVLETAREMKRQVGSLNLENLRDAVAFLTDGGRTNLLIATPELRSIA